MIYLGETKEELEKAIEDSGIVSEEVAEVLNEDEMEKDKMQAELLEKERLLEESNDRYKRLQADFDNFRRRTRQEKEELSNIVAQNIILELLPVIDNFERALSASYQDEKMLAGVEMIYRQLNQALEKNGLALVEAVGKAFDPQQHEAVIRVEDAEQPDGMIVEELQKGYAVKGKVIRPSMVKVISN